MVTFLAGAKYTKAIAFFRLMIEVEEGSHPEDVKSVAIFALYDAAVNMCGGLVVHMAVTENLKHLGGRAKVLNRLADAYPKFARYAELAPAAWAREISASHIEQITGTNLV